MGEVFESSDGIHFEVVLQENDGSSLIIKEESDDGEEFVEYCLVCKKSDKDHGNYLDIFKANTSSSGDSAAHLLINMIMRRSNDEVTFNNTTICSKCFNLLDRADYLQSVLTKAKAELVNIKKDFRTNLNLIEEVEEEEEENLMMVDEEIETQDQIEELSYEEDENNGTTYEPRLDRPTNATNITPRNRAKKKMALKEIMKDKYKCNICNLNHPSQHDLDTHVQETHPYVAENTSSVVIDDAYDFFIEDGSDSLMSDTPPSLSCKFCETSYFTSMTKLKCHFKESHQPYSCLRCTLCQGFVVTGINDLLIHFVFYHPNIVFKKGSAQILVLSREIYDPDSKGAVMPCILCTNTFIDCTDLSIHKLTHSMKKYPEGLKPYNVIEKRNVKYSCPVCQDKFSVARLRFHLNDYHTMTKVLVCKICSMEFNKHFLLNNHQYNIHSLHKPIKNHQCKYCGQYYSGPSKLKIHTSTVHEMIRSYVCDICGSAYKIKSALKKHLLIHTAGEGKAKCKLCHKEVRDIRGHLKKRHNLSQLPRSNNPLEGHLLPYEKK